jgi:hypothetical protein
LFQGNSNFSHHSPHFPILLKSTLLIDWLWNYWFFDKGIEKIICKVMVIGENRMYSIPMNSISTLKELKARAQCLEGRKVLYMYISIFYLVFFWLFFDCDKNLSHENCCSLITHVSSLSPYL